MNIKNRLKKIADGLNVNSPFCQCDREITIKVLPNGGTHDNLPDTCQDCGKRVERKRFTFNFNNDVEIKLIRPTYRVIEPGEEEYNQYEH